LATSSSFFRADGGVEGRKFPSFKRIADIKLWCTRCGERQRVELDATKALGNDRVP
jgi:hypothetical protein